MADGSIPIVALASLVVVLVAWGAARSIRRAREREFRAHEAAEHARRLKNEFVSMVSHELRTPLTSIAGFADTLRSGWRALPESEVDEFLRIITGQAHHLGELVEDVLVIPRLEAGRLSLEPGVFDISEMSNEVTDIVFPPGDGRDVSVVIPGGTMANADRRRVVQIVRNLCENAKKYGGDQILIEGLPLGNQYLLVVADDGPGVAMADRERIFEHFEQVTKGDARSEDGIGLGLPIARRLARAMGGDVWYEERFPTGARFCFTVRTAEPMFPAVDGMKLLSGAVPTTIPALTTPIGSVELAVGTGPGQDSNQA